MHIAYLHPHFSYPGGAGTVVLETAKRLQQRGLKISIVTQTINSDIKSRYPEIYFQCVGGQLPNSISYWVNFFYYYKRVERILDEIQPDIIFPHVFPSNYWGFLYKRHNPEIPCIWFCHEPSAFVHDKRVINGLPQPMRSLAKLSNPVMQLLDRKLVSYSDHIIVNSNFTAKRCKEVYGYASSDTIYPGIDIEEFPATPLEKEKFFLCVSQLTKFKNVDQVITTVALLKEKGVKSKLSIIGDGSEKKNLVKQTKNLEISENIHFLGKVDREQLISYYARALCVVFLSIDEPFGIVPIEAQAAWTPVIATRSGGPLESVIDGESGFLINPNSIMELMEKMSYLSLNPHVAVQMGMNGRNIVSQSFSWDNAANRLLEVFARYVD